MYRDCKTLTQVIFVWQDSSWRAIDAVTVDVSSCFSLGPQLEFLLEVDDFPERRGHRFERWPCRHRREASDEMLYRACC